MNFPAPFLVAVAFTTLSLGCKRDQLRDLVGTGEPDITGRHMFMRRALYTILLIAPLTIPVALTGGTAAATSYPTARIAATGQFPGAAVSAVGQSQCAKPLAERSGNWLCPARPIPASTASSSGGYCRKQGCWYVYSVTKSGYSATGYFGYDDTQLGEVQLYFEVTLNGAHSVSRPVRFESSAAVVNLIFEGNRLLYTPRYPAGTQVGSAGNSHVAGNIPAGETVQWTPNGYKAYYNLASEQSVWHEWSWNMADYPGTWYFWAKSVKFVDVGEGTYHFGDDDDLGENPAGSGYSNG